MKIETLNETANPEALADEQAVLRNLADGTPIPDEIARRIRERTLPTIERIRHTHGVIDDETFQSLIGDDDA